MPRNTIAVRILIASPSDVESERKLLSEVIDRWNAANSPSMGIVLEPIRWETHTHPESGNSPQGIINRQIVDDCDVVVAVFWSRLGTPTTDAVSGTVEEIDRLRARGKRVLVYFSLADLPQGHNPVEFARVQEYKKVTRKDTLYGEFNTLGDLDRLFSGHLSKVVHEIASEINAKPQGAPMRVSNMVSLAPLSAPRQVTVDQNDVWRESTRNDISYEAAIAIFRNEPIKGISLPKIKELKAQITFYGASAGEEQRVYYGTWLDNPYNRTSLDIDDTRELLVALDLKEDGPVTVENPRSDLDHLGRLVTKFKTLDRILYDVKVRLLGQVKINTQVFDEFHFNLDLREQIPILRPGWTSGRHD